MPISPLFSAIFSSISLKSVVPKVPTAPTITIILLSSPKATKWCAFHLPTRYLSNRPNLPIGHFFTYTWARSNFVTSCQKVEGYRLISFLTPSHEQIALIPPILSSTFTYFWYFIDFSEKPRFSSGALRSRPPGQLYVQVTTACTGHIMHLITPPRATPTPEKVSFEKFFS